MGGANMPPPGNNRVKNGQWSLFGDHHQVLQYLCHYLIGASSNHLSDCITSYHLTYSIATLQNWQPFLTISSIRCVCNCVFKKTGCLRWNFCVERSKFYCLALGDNIHGNSLSGYLLIIDALILEGPLLEMRTKLTWIMIPLPGYINMYIGGGVYMKHSPMSYILKENKIDWPLNATY